jgi:hypothetical protein
VTEAQWRRCADPVPMFPVLSGLTTGRKLRLFAAACCRRIAHVLPDERILRALDAAERLADGTIDPSEWADAEARAKEVRRGIHPLLDAQQWNAVVASVIAVSHASCPDHELQLAANTSAAARRAVQAEPATHAHLVREVFGDPVRPVKFSSAWRTSTVVALAAQMYERREFSAMPILADALQDAGCESVKILNHCRDTNQVHVLGCWVVDLVLGKQ